MRDYRSRAFLAPLCTEDVKRDLGWQPVADREMFLRQASFVQQEQEGGERARAPQPEPVS